MGSMVIVCIGTANDTISKVTFTENFILYNN